ncbi:hypothetical protein SAMD00023378_1803 [Ralstonia sp. NT80]|nr:hypothetical protein SAMD00023378_1803 [Ralstonia sp. NT80]
MLLVFDGAVEREQHIVVVVTVACKHVRTAALRHFPLRPELSVLLFRDDSNVPAFVEEVP